jgi:N-methylhydantoinase B
MPPLNHSGSPDTHTDPRTNKDVHGNEDTQENTPNPILLEVFKNRFSSICEEMGVTLNRTAFSPNIKERRDFSCALFDADGSMIAQAAHIPVHLGSMPMSVKAAIDAVEFEEGDMVMLNDPYKGGTHLPDITIVAPVFIREELSPTNHDANEEIMGTNNDQKQKNEKAGSPHGKKVPKPRFFVANRAHHADVGGMTSGSMPLSTSLFQEGVIIPPLKIMKKGQRDNDLMSLFLSNVRTPQEREGDFAAQIMSNLTGIRRIQELVKKYGLPKVKRYATSLMDYSEIITRKKIASIPDGVYEFQDQLDDDGKGTKDIHINVILTISGDGATLDFRGSHAQVTGSVNAVYSITLSAVIYAFRTLIKENIPFNAGCFKPITVITKKGTIVDALFPAAVAGGNVETSQRVVDTVLGALEKALPGQIPAASQGTMNNLTVGGMDQRTNAPFAYYETLAGGMGATATSHGESAVHSHMTNTLNTPVEALEYSYPFLVTEYAIRKNSGGRGRFSGGEGMVRQMRMLSDAEMTVLSERRVHPPHGIDGGAPGGCGRNYIIRNGKKEIMPGKFHAELKKGDTLRIETPGGGGYGAP